MLLPLRGKSPSRRSVRNAVRCGNWSLDQRSRGSVVNATGHCLRPAAAEFLPNHELPWREASACWTVMNKTRNANKCNFFRIYQYTLWNMEFRIIVGSILFIFSIVAHAASVFPDYCEQFFHTVFPLSSAFFFKPWLPLTFSCPGPLKRRVKSTSKVA